MTAAVAETVEGNGARVLAGAGLAAKQQIHLQLAERGERAAQRDHRGTGAEEREVEIDGIEGRAIRARRVHHAAA